MIGFILDSRPVQWAIAALAFVGVMTAIVLRLEKRGAEKYRRRLEDRDEEVAHDVRSRVHEVRTRERPDRAAALERLRRRGLLRDGG